MIDLCRDVLERCAKGELSPAIALLRLLSICGGREALQAPLDQAGRNSALADTVARVRSLLDANLEGAALVCRLLRHERSQDGPLAADELERCRQLFDRLVAEDPAASVALYSFGNSTLLDAATREVVALLDRLAVVREEREVLEIGCGIGRFEEALAGRVRAITGIDIAPGMIVAARRRCAGLPNVRLIETSGRDLSQFPAGSFDLVLAIDVMPYMYRSGPDLVSKQVREVARVLRSCGDLVLLNLSYRGDLGGDRADIERLASEAGFAVLRNGVRDLRLWDAATFHLRKARARCPVNQDAGIFARSRAGPWRPKDT